MCLFYHVGDKIGNTHLLLPYNIATPLFLTALLTK